MVGEIEMFLQRRLSWPILAVVVIAAAVATGAVVGLARSGDDAAKSALDALSGDGHESIVVAELDGEQISLREIDVLQAIGAINGAVDPGGRAISDLSRSELLDRVVRDHALGIAAERSGVTASDEEVTMMINASFVDPIKSGTMPKETRELLESHLKAMGTSIGGAPTDPELRRAYRRFLLIQRYVAATGKSSTQLASAAVSNLEIKTYPDRLSP